MLHKYTLFSTICKYKIFIFLLLHHGDPTKFKNIKKYELKYLITEFKYLATVSILDKSVGELFAWLQNLRTFNMR